MITKYNYRDDNGITKNKLCGEYSTKNNNRKVEMKNETKTTGLIKMVVTNKTCKKHNN